MENVNLHKQKLIALAIAGVALISIFLPWATVSFSGFGGFDFGGFAQKRSVNGFKGWEGFVALIGVIGVAVASFMEDKTKPYEGNMKLIAMAGFGLMALAALITLMSTKGAVKAGFGVYLCIIAGIAGVVWVAGLIKLPENNPNPPAPPTPPQS